MAAEAAALAISSARITKVIGRSYCAQVQPQPTCFLCFSHVLCHSRVKG